MATARAPRRRAQSATGSRPRTAAVAHAYYVESSALVAALLEHDADVMKPLPVSTRRATSALTLSEAGRAIVRARTTGGLTEDDEKAAIRALRTFERDERLRANARALGYAIE